MRHRFSVNCGAGLKITYTVAMVNWQAFPAIIALLLFSQASWAGDVRAMIADKDYAGAMKLAKQTPPADVILQVGNLAKINDAPAQWILAEAYWRNKNIEKAATWAYTALVSTELDATSCELRQSIVPWMRQSYEVIFISASRDPKLVDRAVRGALSHHAAIHTLPRDVQWACRVGAFLVGKPDKPNVIQSLTVKETQRRRQEALDRLVKKAGFSDLAIQLP